MKKLGFFTKPLNWFISLLMVAFVVGCGNSILGGGGSNLVVANSSSKAITAFSLSGIAGTINEAAKTITVALPYGTSKTQIATFTSTGLGAPMVGSTLQASGITQNDFTSPVVYVVTAADASTATYTVTVTVASASAKAITVYSINGIAGVINEAAGTIAVTLPNGTPVTSLVATFTSTGLGAPTVGSTPQTSGTTPNDFTTPVAYIVTAADASTATYVVTVTLAAASVSDKAITAYSLSGVAGKINESAKTIAVTLPTGTAVTSLAATFTSTGAGAPKVGGVNQISGTTLNNFTNPVLYIVTATDASTATYTVTVTFAPLNPTAPTLGEAGRFVILAYAGVSTTGLTSISNGDIGVTPMARTYLTGFTSTGPAGDYTELTGLTWPGMPSTSYAPADANPAPFPYPLKYASPHAVWSTTGAMLTQSSGDEDIAYTFLAADPNPGAPTQVCPTQLGGLTLTRGVYKTALNVLITTGTLNLDAQGDSNAVWIFSIDGTLTTGAPGGNIVFVGGVGSAKNVYWRVAGKTIIGGYTAFIGNVFDAGSGIDVLFGTNINGTLFSTAGAVTLIADTIVKP
jgi:hypothetical protein